MEIPNLVRERLGGESIEATVTLGDEDVIAVTPTRTILYRGEGLLSDESVEVYAHDVERLTLSKGRRNTKFSLTYVDGTKAFKVPGDRTDTLLEILVQGLLRSAGVAGEDESVAGVFRFSELTLVVTEARLVKHVGTPVWDSDFDVFDFADVTGLDFEEGSVATQIVLTVDGRPQRIKAPSDQAPQVEQTLTQTLCAYYDVGSLAELTRTLETDAEADDDGADSLSGELELDDGISPLVGRSDDSDTAVDGPTAAAGGDSPALDPSGEAGADRGQASDVPSAPSHSNERPSDKRSRPAGADDRGQRTDAGATARDRPSASTAEPVSPADDGGVDQADLDAITDQLSTLTEAVKRQNALLRRHSERLDATDEKVEQLIDELRRGR